MAPENVRERKEKRHFTVVLISGTNSSETRTFSASIWRVITVIASLLIVLTALITAAIVYTPIGSRLPIANPKLEIEYGGQIQDIRQRMEILFGQISVLRGYNLRLRRAMGEKISPADSSLIAEGRIDTSRPLPVSPAATDPDPAESGESRGADGQQAIDESAEDGFGLGRIAGLASGEIPDGSDVALPFSMPTRGFVTREFEPTAFHYGIDFAAKEGTPVWAAAPGYVIFSGWSAAEGNMLMISHPRGFITVYKHNKSLMKSVGEAVLRGDLIALVGNTGKSSAPHLHFEVWKDGLAQNAGLFLLTTQ